MATTTTAATAGGKATKAGSGDGEGRRERLLVRERKDTHTDTHSKTGYGRRAQRGTAAVGVGREVSSQATTLASRSADMMVTVRERVLRSREQTIRSAFDMISDTAVRLLYY